MEAQLQDTKALMKLTGEGMQSTNTCKFLLIHAEICAKLGATPP